MLQVRLHGSRVLAYVIPAVGPQLDALMSPTILPAVITNLAHFSPALRSSSMDAILVYVQHSADPEFVLKSMIVQGLDVSGAKSSLTVNVMECVPVVLQQIVKRNGERPVSEKKILIDYNIYIICQKIFSSRRLSYDLMFYNYKILF